MALPSRERKRLLANLVDETNGAALYDALAAAEKDTRLAEVYHRLADVERRHGDRWRKRLLDAGEKIPDIKPSWRTRTLSWMARRFGSSAVLPSVQALEQTDSDKYSRQADAKDLHGEEKSHARVIGLMASMS